MTLTPGIRPFGEDAGDQKRVADVAFAKEALVDFIVVGRPIYQANNPISVVKKILENLQSEDEKVDSVALSNFFSIEHKNLDKEGKAKKGKKDTRLKHIYLSSTGEKIFNEIFSVQKKRIYKALLSSTSEEVLFFDNVLKKIIHE